MKARYSQAGLQTATISWSHLANTEDEYHFIGTHGSITLAPPAHCPTTVVITERQCTENGENRRVARSTVHEFALPEIPGAVFNDPNSQGLVYEIAAVQRCLTAGLLGCPQNALKESLAALRLVENSVQAITQ